MPGSSPRTSEWLRCDSHEARTVGQVEDVENLLVRGDALHALTSLRELPGYRARYAGKVTLCYIDPPFNTGQAFEYYDDALELRLAHHAARSTCSNPPSSQRIGHGLAPS